METQRPLARVRAAVTAALLLLALGTCLHVSAASGATLLPNLVADPPDTQSIATDTSTGTPRLLLRFNGYIHNKGPGAVDFRGSREAPKVSQKTTEEVERAREKEESLPQKTEEELAVPPMHTFQRLFTTNTEEKNIERAHVDEPSSGELVYAAADGHHHWHLQKIARYSLWNASKAAEVAPAQKVGFCLDDSQHVETSIGPSSAVYSDNVAPFREFCERYRPNATSLFEGISVGWRDVYDSSLAFQWVDLSNVLPGEYWLREDVNTLGFVKETGGENVPVYSNTATVVPGFDAQPQAAETPAGVAKTITFTAKAFKDTNTPTYKIVSGPAHGTLGAISGGKVTYTPTAGFTGQDSFTFSASDAASRFPENPAVATVSIQVVSSTQPAVSIEGVPASMQAGSSVQLTAKVVNDSPTVTWGASVGSVTSEGRYTAPAEVPAGGTATVTATTSKGAKAEKTIEITPAAGSKGLLAGDGTATYSVADQTGAGREEAFQFTAKATGTVEELLFRTNGTANTGVTGVVLAVFAENAGAPGAVLGSATAAGAPAVSSWIKATGLSVPVTAGTKYWLVALPLGSGFLHYNVSKAINAGTGNVETMATGLTKATAETSWATFNQGPVGFQAAGTAGEAQPSVAIEGAPASMTAGSSVQLTAKVANDSPTVTWGASAGTVTSEGRYTAPSEVPAGGKVTITATTSKGAKAEKTIEITAPAPSVTIEGAPVSMQAGASVQLTAKVVNDSPTVAWGASAGTVTSEGRYTAPSEVPAGGKATVTATTTKGAKAEKTIEITPAAGPKGLLVGDPTATYTVSDQTGAGHEEAFQFTAAAGGTVEELLFRTNTTANTGVTGVVLALFAENGGVPGEVLGSATAPGTPAVSSWIKATGLSVPVTAGTKYWLIALPLGSGFLHYNVSKAMSAGTGNLESQAGAMTKVTAQTSWWTFNQGPIGFQANGTTGAAPALARAAAVPRSTPPAGRVAVAGAPQIVTSGTAVQLSAVTAGASGPVSWTSSAGSVAADGLFVAPRVHAATPVTIGATAPGARGQAVHLVVAPAPADAAAPTAASVGATGLGGAGQGLGAMSAMIFNRELVITTAAGRAGVATIVAHAGHRLLGGCSSVTPAGVGVTCRLSLQGASPHAHIRVSALLRRGHRVLGSRSVAGVALPTMKLMARLPRLAGGGMSSMFSYICSPALRTGGPGAIASLP